MAAPKGNQFWKARTKHGRDKLCFSADALRGACCQYFEWVEETTRRWSWHAPDEGLERHGIDPGSIKPDA